jgi:hypothetical protein
LFPLNPQKAQPLSNEGIERWRPKKVDRVWAISTLIEAGNIAQNQPLGRRVGRFRVIDGSEV